MAQFFEIGKSSPKTEAIKFSEAIADALMIAVNKAKAINVNVFEKQLTKTIRESYKKAVMFAALNMIGTNSPVGSTKMKTFSSDVFNNYGARESGTLGVVQPAGSVNWRALSYDTMKKKKKLGQPERSFFIATGKLRNFLKRRASAIVNNTGVVKVDRRQNFPQNPNDPRAQRTRDARGRFLPEQIQVADLSIRIMPKVPAAFLPGVKANNIGRTDPNQRFEGLVVNNQEIEDKLYGPERDRNRPLLQPVFTFWTQYYIPRQIENALRNSVG